MRLSKEAQRKFGVAAAICWMTVPAAWGIATIVDRTQPWEGTPQRWFLLGWAALMAAGALTTLVVASDPGDRPRLRTAGVITMILGVAISAGIGWAIPLWTTTSVSILLLRKIGILRTEAWMLFVLTMLLLLLLLLFRVELAATW